MEWPAQERGPLASRPSRALFQTRHSLPRLASACQTRLYFTPPAPQPSSSWADCSRGPGLPRSLTVRRATIRAAASNPIPAGRLSQTQPSRDRVEDRVAYIAGERHGKGRPRRSADHQQSVRQTARPFPSFVSLWGWFSRLFKTFHVHFFLQAVRCETAARMT